MTANLEFSVSATATAEVGFLGNGGSASGTVGVTAGVAATMGQSFSSSWSRGVSTSVTAHCGHRTGKTGKLWQFRMTGEGNGDHVVWDTNKYKCTYDSVEIPRCSPIPSCTDGGACVRC